MDSNDESKKRSVPRWIGNYNNWMDSVVSEHQKKGGFDNLIGKGNPINFEESKSNDENYLSNKIMKNANILPEWLELQHEIRDDLKRLVELIQNQSELDLNEKLKEINKQIKRYNQLCPRPILQKSPVYPDTVVDQVKNWL